MKWKVVKNPRSSSADRSLECLRNDVQQQANNNNNAPNVNKNDNNNNNTSNNNNAGDESKPDNNSPAAKETNRQRESSLIRKPSIVATECINLKSILGLTRQRSETNLSNLGLISTDPRRSRSEVRGVSCDRLTVGYHTAPGKPFENGKTRSSSPPSRSGWLRGRKRERESRNPVKNNQDAFGKTIVTGSSSKRTSSKTRNGDCRTILDGADGKQKNKLCSLELRKSKSSKKNGEDDIIEEEIYCEINNDSNVRGKLLEENKDVAKVANKVIRKKGLAPKPQITTALFKDADVNINPVGRKLCESPVSLNEVAQSMANRKPPRKNQTYNGRNQDRKCENRAMHSVKINNLKNTEKSMVKTKNAINAQSVVAVAEVHQETIPSSINNKIKNVSNHDSVKNTHINNAKVLQHKECVQNQKNAEGGQKDESLPFYIDTPDYSTLESVHCNNDSESTDDVTLSKDDIINCNTDCDESLLETTPSVVSDSAKVPREISLSSILRDSSNESKDAEPKKTVRFEKLDLIEKYKKNKIENSMDTEEDTDASVSESKPLDKTALDVNSNEITPQTVQEDTSPCPENTANEVGSDTNCPNSMTVNVVVRNPSPTPLDAQNEETSTQFVVKKSFVLTIAKQEKGFKSLCATKKPEVIPEPPKIDQQQISVTFLCSGPPSEGWVLPVPGDHQRLRSTSVPPRSLQPAEAVTALPAIRGRSRERRSKERQHCKKNHKARKKDAVFVMPQAVIDELSQVLEKRKPSLDEIPVHP